MMKIIQNPDADYAREIKRMLKANNGYCPCALEKTPDTKCMCKDFRDMVSGTCQCGLYMKVGDNE